VDGQTAERIVLGDWYEQGSVLQIDSKALDLRAIRE
jgi:UDP-2,3-diacylglucosamine hydrolase